ncbi:hypothetical protein V5799_000797 [Amblyomma americanum]|uniref:Uncharacterized protein n=1 Tax=Amblyomma americanum TaxID=6943 RepID=A0AAQ4D214_AMBAM
MPARHKVLRGLTVDRLTCLLEEKAAFPFLSREWLAVPDRRQATSKTLGPQHGSRWRFRGRCSSISRQETSVAERTSR